MARRPTSTARSGERERESPLAPRGRGLTSIRCMGSRRPVPVGSWYSATNMPPGPRRTSAGEASAARLRVEAACEAVAWKKDMAPSLCVLTEAAADRQNPRLRARTESSLRRRDDRACASANDANGAAVPPQTIGRSMIDCARSAGRLGPRQHEPARGATTRCRLKARCVRGVCHARTRTTITHSIDRTGNPSRCFEAHGSDVGIQLLSIRFGGCQVCTQRNPPTPSGRCMERVRAPERP